MSEIANDVERLISLQPFGLLIVASTFFVIVFFPTNHLIRILILYVQLLAGERERNVALLRRWHLAHTSLKLVFSGSISLNDRGLDLSEDQQRIVKNDYVTVVRFGSWTGSIERAILLLLAFFGEFSAMGFLMAAKALVATRLGKSDKEVSQRGIGRSEAASGDEPRAAIERHVSACADDRNEQANADQREALTPSKSSQEPGMAISATPDSDRIVVDDINITQETYVLGTLASFAVAIFAGCFLAWYSVDDQKLSRDDKVGIQMRNEKQKVLMDVDTGVDDALAIMLALHSPHIELVGITTVSGNTSSEQAARNTRMLLDMFGERQLPVSIGEATSLSGTTSFAGPEIHGIDGLGGVSDAYWGDADVGLNRGGVEFILNIARTYGSRLTIVATGPLTNIARAIEKHPAAMKRIGGLLVMGGAVETAGNIPPDKVAEFNVHCDPEAYTAVLASGIEMKLFPLDVTEKVKLLASDLDKSKDVNERKILLIRDMARTYMEFHANKKEYGFKGSFIHDALPIAYLNEPSLFEFESMDLVVEPSSSPQAGRTRVADEDEVGTPVTVAMTVKRKRVLHQFWTRLKNDEPNCLYARARQ